MTSRLVVRFKLMRCVSDAAGSETSISEAAATPQSAFGRRRREGVPYLLSFTVYIAPSPMDLIFKQSTSPRQACSGRLRSWPSATSLRQN